MDLLVEKLAAEYARKGRTERLYQTYIGEDEDGRTLYRYRFEALESEPGDVESDTWRILLPDEDGAVKSRCDKFRDGRDD